MWGKGGNYSKFLPFSENPFPHLENEGFGLSFLLTLIFYNYQMSRTHLTVQKLILCCSKHMDVLLYEENINLDKLRSINFDLFLKRHQYLLFKSTQKIMLLRSKASLRSKSHSNKCITSYSYTM